VLGGIFNWFYSTEQSVDQVWQNQERTLHGMLNG
ncbi:uncharacterized protein METZ01_LOCUS164927, partial [marine metagenome]